MLFLVQDAQAAIDSRERTCVSREARSTHTNGVACHACEAGFTPKVLACRASLDVNRSRLVRHATSRTEAILRRRMRTLLLGTRIVLALIALTGLWGESAEPLAASQGSGPELRQRSLMSPPQGTSSTARIARACPAGTDCSARENQLSAFSIILSCGSQLSG